MRTIVRFRIVALFAFALVAGACSGDDVAPDTGVPTSDSGPPDSSRSPDSSVDSAPDVRNLDAAVREIAPEHADGPRLDAPSVDTTDAGAPPEAASDALPDAKPDAPDGALGDDGPSTGLSGTIEKGPFVAGSSVTISEIDHDGNATGRVFNTQTVDNLGRFSESTVPSIDVSISSTGIYYDELLARLSTTPLTLRAFHRITAGGHTATVNIITDLVYDRVAVLLGSGTDLDAAQAQALSELKTALGIGTIRPTTPADGWSLLGGDSIEGAYLFAISVIFEQAAMEAAGTTDAGDETLARLIRRIGADLADGNLDPEGANALKKAERRVPFDDAMQNLQQRLDSFGAQVTVPDLNRVLDSDGDRLPNRSDNCPLVSNSAQLPITGAVCRTKAVSVAFASPDWNVARIAVGDFDEDQHQDLVTIGVGPSVALLGDGNGNFQTRAVPSTMPAFARRWYSQDVNQDGHLDLVAFQPSDNPMSDGGELPAGYYPGDGHANFGAWVPCVALADGGSATPATSGTFADFDGDGKLDLVSTTTSGALNLAIGDGHGSFGAGRPVALTADVDATPPELAIFVLDARVNADSNPDLLVLTTQGADRSIVALLGDGAGHFTQTERTPFRAPADDMVTGDVNGDGALDIVIPNGDVTGSELSVSYGDNTGHFTVPASMFAGFGGSRSAFVSAKFLGSDRLGTIAFLAKNDSYDLLYLPGENPPFTAPQILPQWEHHPSGGSNVLAAADLDGDGQPDLIFSDYDSRAGQTKIWAMLLH